MKISEAIFQIGNSVNPSETVDALKDKVDRNELIKMRLENSKFYYEQGLNLINSPSLACEMFYESIVEGMKCLKDYFGIQKELRESIPLISDILGDWINESWDLALKLHYDGYILEIIEKEDLIYYTSKIKSFIDNCEIAISY
ncbi:hypothetical protein DFR86_02860 [Acidianus sulfidivorans JP7]|uniref:PaREP1 family protein n=1 Tax=Acidianus sulfidivorans JP7 TaxID=619593 RepID=A0A2U9IKP7_9CREN|nr:hypothetical protein [Acidianus sulfidivorans]AWR96593.1 hypothetical protein DFR86_02860 [Acidianus sulfidivorans JP7]